MTEERHSERPSEQAERQIERDSQLSAMFDGELPGAECELLARRLARDEALRAQWSRYSMIGAALRAERGVALHDRVAWKVQSVVAQEPVYGQEADAVASADSARTASLLPASRATARQRWSRIAMPVAGAGIAASVAAASIFWLQGAQESGEVMLAGGSSPATIVLAPDVAGTPIGEPSTVALNNPPVDSQPAANDEPGSYVTPAPNDSPSIAPPARLANYVVAHSEYSSPLSRRMALLGIVGAEGDNTPAPEAAPAAEASDAP